MARKRVRQGSPRKTVRRRRPSVTAVQPVPPVVPQIGPQYRLQRWREQHAPNPAMLRNIMCIEGYTVFQWSDPPGTLYGTHKHESLQSHWIISGSLEITVQGKGANILGPGDRDHLPENTYHSARVIGDEPVIYLIGEIPLKVTDRGRT